MGQGEGAEVSTPGSERRYCGLDALRGAMMMLGIVLHAAMFYIAAPPPGMPLVGDHNNSVVFDELVHFIHSFRMPAFFVLAGFFAALLVEKRGVWGTYKNRLARVAAPLAVGMVTVLPPALWFMVLFAFAVRFGTYELLPTQEQARIFGREAAARGMEMPGVFLGHLWFLYYLCYFYLLIPVCRLVVSASRRIEPGLRRWLASPAAFAAFSVYTALTLWPFAGGQLHDVLRLASLEPDPRALLYYGSFFLLGYVSHTYRDAAQLLMVHVWRWGLLALVLFPLAQYASHLEYYRQGSHLVAVLGQACCTWALIYFFVGLALRYCDRPSPWVLYTSQSAYWVFLVHMPVIAVLGWWLVRYDLPAGIKFTLVTGIATVICFATYHYAVQRTWISRFLNGKRFNLDWPWRKTHAIPQAAGS
jgi:glucans biosynthesis protein C